MFGSGLKVFFGLKSPEDDLGFRASESSAVSCRPCHGLKTSSMRRSRLKEPSK